MKEEYDFSKGKRGAIEPTPPGKTRITIRLDNEVIDWFRGQIEARGGGNYQTMINNVLRAYISQNVEDLEERMRRVIREEITKINYQPVVAVVYVSPETAGNQDIRSDIPLDTLSLTGTHYYNTFNTQ